ncbi:peptidase dimerization domain-containing protein [Spiribacter salilacus]|uniref:peptidase dimerization domain-containing protein n=1 Tax=Spiribacter salilacus TaxID=2664894 RepID=UPI001561B2BB
MGQVEGGQALNVIAASCHFDFEIRYLPGSDVEALITRIQKKATVLELQASASGINARIHLHESSRYPGASVSVQSPAIRWLSSCLPEAQFEQADYGTEAGCLQAALGIDAIVCGPGNISRAHRPNEYITRQELAAGEKMLRRVLGLSVLDA